ncbi:MAG: hypothetical protein JWM19_5469 [Actinomycetia bacterium]|nr:hypothetical protein [Actinomycetes bacterium]
MGDLGEGKGYFYEEYGPCARDQRLELFGQGGWADRARGSGWLALQAGDVSRPEALGRALDDELLGIGRAWKTLETWIFTGKLAVVRELIRRYPLNERDEPGTAAGGLPDEWDPRLHHEVAAALGISLVAAGKLVNLTWTLDTRLPGIGKALEGNQLDPSGARMIADETSVLEGEALFARAEELILAGLAGCATWTALQRLAQRAVITADPDGARKRREQAEREHARLRFWRENCGTFAMQASGLPADEALAANARIEGRARAYKAARIARPMDILRVMAYLDLINEVTIAQRVAWAQADVAAPEAAARDAGADEQAARDAELRKARENARRRPAASKAGQEPETGKGHGDAPDNDPGSPDSGEPDGDDPGSPGGDGPDSDGPGSPGGGVPDGDDPGSPDGDDPGSPGGGVPDGGGPAGRDGGSHGNWPTGDGAHEDDDLDGGFDGGPGDGPLPEDPGGDGGDWEQPEPPEPPGAADDASDYRPCPACRGAGGGTGLPVTANLTLPAGALDWLAEWSAGRTGNAARGPTGNGPGDGGPGGRYRGGPGPCPACGKPGSTAMPALSDLALPLLTLLGAAERPGEAHGLGALDPALARDLTAAGARHPGSTFCITVTDEHGFAIGHGCCRPMRGKKGTAIPADPDRVTIIRSGRTGPDGGYGSWILTLPGAPLPFLTDIDPVPTYDCDHRHESRAYQPSGKLRHLIQVRDGKCSFPACSRHARDSDFEHAQPYGKGGRTCACNAHCASRSCHRAKQSPGWHVTKPRPGWTRWTTRAGRTYEQGPWRYPD